MDNETNYDLASGKLFSIRLSVKLKGKLSSSKRHVGTGTGTAV